MGLTKPRAAQIFNLDYKQSTRVVTTTNITLSGGAPSLVDGVILSLGDRILVTGQSTGNQNGLYYVTTLGSGANGTWARTSDGNENGEIEAGMIVMVTEGTIYADTQWKLITDDPIIINTTALTFTQNYMANSISGGTSNVVVNTNAAVTISSAGTANVISVGSTAVTFTGNVNPSANVTYTLGNTSNRWKDLWLSNSSIYLGNIVLAATATALTVDGVPVVTSASGAISATGNITGGNILTGGLVSATGNVTGNYILGNGALLTGVITSVANINNGTSNVTVVSSGGNVTVGVGGTGNVAVFANTGLFVTGVLSATGNATAGNILTAGLISATSTITSAANVVGGNIVTAGLITATGNIQGGNLRTAGLISATGSINLGGNLNFTNAESTDSAKIYANVSAATTSLVLEVSDDDASDRIVLRHFFFNTSTNVDMLVAQRSGNTEANVTITGNLIATNQVTATGNVIGGNIRTAGLITATGNITGGNVLTAGLVSATGTITSAGNLSLTGNIVDIGELWINTSANGNINLNPNGTGQTNIPAGILSVTGNIQGGNLRTAGLITATGDITGANITGVALSATGTTTGSSIIASGVSTGAALIGATGRNSGSLGTFLNLTGNSNPSGVNAYLVNAQHTLSPQTNLNNWYGLLWLPTIGSFSGNIVNMYNQFIRLDTSATGNANITNWLGTYVSPPSLTVGSTPTIANYTGIRVDDPNNAVANATSAFAFVSQIARGTNRWGAYFSGTANNYFAGNVGIGVLSAGNALDVSGTVYVSSGNILTTGLISATGNVTGGNVNTSALRSGAGALTISTGSGAINLQPAGGNIVLSANTYINNVAQPLQNQDAATKLYVDNAVSTAISYHQPVTAATTTTLATTTGGTITYTQPNGASNGVGALLTTTGTFNLIDTANVQTLGTRILVKNEANAVFNGVYTWANATNIVRATDADTAGAGNTSALGLNDYFFVSSGNVNLGSAFIVSAPTTAIVFGTSNISFAQFSQSQVYTANTAAGISLSGTVINAKVDGVTTAFDGGGNISVKASANLTTPNIGAATGTSLNVTGNVDAGNVRTTGLVTATGNVTGGNINTNGLITATGNVTGGNLLTGGLISATSTITSAANITGGNLLTAGVISATGAITSASNISLTGNIVDIGEMWINTSANGNINLNVNGTGQTNIPTGILSVTGNIQGGNLRTAGLITATGNVTGGNLLTGGLISATSTITSAANITGGNITTAGVITATGNVDAGNLRTAGLISATSSITSAANVTGGNILTGGLISATSTITSAANVTGGNVLTGGLITATGNVTGGNVLTAGLISATSTITSAANVVGGNITTTGLVTATGNVTGGNVLTGGIVSATSNVTGGNLLTAGVISATGAITSASNISLTGNIIDIGELWVNTTANGNINLNPNGTGQTNIPAGILSVTGNIQGGNLLTGGLISATGNVTGNYFIGNGSQLTGIVAATPTSIVNGTSNVVVASSANVTVGVTGNNIATFTANGLLVTGVVSGSGNVTGGNVLTAGIMSSTGNGIHGNILTAGLISATGNLQAGNILTAGVISATGNGVIAGRNLLIGAAYTTYSTAGRGIVAINGTGDQILEFANGVTNYGYLYHSGTNMFMYNNRPGSMDINATNGNINFVTNSTQRVQIDSTGIVSVTGNVQAGNLRTAGLITATGNVQGGNLRTAGLITATGTITSAANVVGGNITTAGLITATGNITGGNFLTTGFVSATGNSRGGNINTDGLVTASGNVIGGNLLTVGLISATGAITSAGNLSLTGNIVDIGEMWINTSANGNINLNPNGTGQVNIPAGILSVTGNIQGGNLRTAGLITATGNVTGGNILTVGQVSATGNVSGNFFVGNGAFLTGLSAGTSNGISNGATAISIPVASGNIAMSVAGQSNTVVINLGSFTMYGTFAGPRTLAANVTVAPAVNALLLGPVTVDDGYNITVPSDSSLSTYSDASPDIVGSTVVVSGNITGGNIRTAGEVTATGNITGFNILTAGLISTTGNITGGNITTAGNITGNNIFTSGSILPTANATANIGNSSFQYNTIFAKATSAQYADLAENYEADDTYEPGTVLCFGGSKEVTVCNVEDCTRVAGVVSTNPSYLMNSGQTGVHVASLALQGRVPTKVTGQVRKGDLMVSAGNGQAKTNNEARAGTIIGKALANSEGDTVIEVVVGRD